MKSQVWIKTNRKFGLKQIEYLDHAVLHHFSYLA